ncbi:hypothetical protein Golob_004370 [Gossypium lobatum]|uniref:Uncharacterized protein n=1 Tax=Gossypium lobatum TaxID=34289 RepID=A0A7J8N1G5_9ROSI|nr:hypothetical protein [Gossypium lobatum]
MIMVAYLSQKMMTILMFVEEFRTYNPNSASPHFCIGMLFKDVNFVLEFVMLWDDAGELRLKNPGSTIKMAMNRVTPKSPPHFKRFYVYFKTMKRGWKEGCKLIPGLDGCFLKGPFKGALFVAVRRDGNN